MRRGSKRYFSLLRELVIADYQLKDQSTFFGFAWSFLNPLLMLSVLFFMFNRRFGQNIEHYPIYLLLGIIQYTHFSNSTNRSMRILSTMRKLTANTIFPKEILVTASVLGDLMDFVLALGVGLAIAAFSGVGLGSAALLLPTVVVLQFIITLWVSLLLSCAFVFVPDIGHIYQVFLRLLLFITPIFYGRNFVGEGLGQIVLQLNPLTHLIGFSRTLVIEGTPYSGTVFVAALVANVVLLALSLRIFTRFEPRFAETI